MPLEVDLMSAVIEAMATAMMHALDRDETCMECCLVKVTGAQFRPSLLNMYVSASDKRGHKSTMRLCCRGLEYCPQGSLQ